jgi:hypothetical protein
MAATRQAVRQPIHNMQLTEPTANIGDRCTTTFKKDLSEQKVLPLIG